jgi:hypothetical protein
VTRGALAPPKANLDTTIWSGSLPRVPIAVPTITLEGDANGAPHPDANAYVDKFTGKYSHRVIEGGIGHNLPQEAPQAFAEAIIDVDSYLTAVRLGPESRGPYLCFLRDEVELRESGDMCASRCAGRENSVEVARSVTRR